MWGNGWWRRLAEVGGFAVGSDRRLHRVGDDFVGPGGVDFLMDGGFQGSRSFGGAGWEGGRLRRAGDNSEIARANGSPG